MFENTISFAQTKQGRFLSLRDGAFAVAFDAAPVIDLTETRVVEARRPATVTLFRRRVRPNPATDNGLTAA